MPSTAIIVIASLLAATIIIVIVMSSSSSQVSDPISNDDILLDDSESDASGLLQSLTESPQEIDIETQEITNNVIQEIIQEDASGVVVSDASGVVVTDASGLVVSDASGVVISDASGVVVSDASGVAVTDDAVNTEVDTQTLLDNEREMVNNQISSSLDDMNQTTENFREDMSGIDIFDIAACDASGNEDHIKCPDDQDFKLDNLMQFDRFGEYVKTYYEQITSETQQDLLLELQSQENSIRKTVLELIEIMKYIFDYKYFSITSASDKKYKANFVKCFNILLMLDNEFPNSPQGNKWEINHLLNKFALFSNHFLSLFRASLERLIDYGREISRPKPDGRVLVGGSEDGKWGEPIYKHINDLNPNNNPNIDDWEYKCLPCNLIKSYKTVWITYFQKIFKGCAIVQKILDNDEQFNQQVDLREIDMSGNILDIENELLQNETIKYKYNMWNELMNRSPTSTSLYNMIMNIDRFVGDNIEEGKYSYIPHSFTQGKRDIDKIYFYNGLDTINEDFKEYLESYSVKDLRMKEYEYHKLDSFIEMILSFISCGEWGRRGSGSISNSYSRSNRSYSSSATSRCGGLDFGGWTFPVCPDHNPEITNSNASILYRLIQMYQEQPGQMCHRRRTCAEIMSRCPEYNLI